MPNASHTLYEKSHILALKNMVFWQGLWEKLSIFLESLVAKNQRDAFA